MSTTKNQRELDAVNQMLASVGQAPVTTLQQSNPDVAIALDTLHQVSREVQAEGWTFNKEYNYQMSLETDGTVNVPDNMLQVSLCESVLSNRNKRAVLRTRNTVAGTDLVQRKLYEIINHTFIWESAPYCDIVWLQDFVTIPVPIQTFIIAKASTMFAQRTTGEQTMITMLMQMEAVTRASALEYETQQINRSFFGYNENGDFYNSYIPFQALSR